MFFSGGVGSVFTKFWKKHPTKKIACLFFIKRKNRFIRKKGENESLKNTQKFARR